MRVLDAFSRGPILLLLPYYYDVLRFSFSLNLAFSRLLDRLLRGTILTFYTFIATILSLFYALAIASF